MAHSRSRGALREMRGVGCCLALLFFSSTAFAQPELQVGSAQDQYDQAFGFLRQRDYGAAEMAFRDFVRLYPDDPLAGNAQYWLGETYFVRDDFSNAAIAFGDGYRTYPQGAKSPESLLKLAMSLGKIGKTDDACAALDQLESALLTAPPSITDRARKEREGIGCMKRKRSADAPARLSASAEEPLGWHLVRVPVLCARYSSLGEGLQAMMKDDAAAAAGAGCFKMKLPLAVRLVEEHDDGQVAKIAYKGQGGRMRTAWTLRAFVEEDSAHATIAAPQPSPSPADEPARLTRQGALDARRSPQE